MGEKLGVKGQPTVSDTGSRPSRRAISDLAGDDRLASALRGVGPLGVLVALLIVGGSGILAPFNGFVPLLWAWRSRTPLAHLGLVRPRRWSVVVAGGVALGVVGKLVMKAVVMPLLDAPPTNQAYAFLQGNTAALPGILLAVTLGAGFGEEMVFRGFLFSRLGTVLGESARARMAIVVASSAWFGLIHYTDQGLPGAQQAFVVGLVLGSLYARTREIWTPIVAHSTFDLTAVALIYWGLESRVAGSVFP